MKDPNWKFIALLCASTLIVSALASCGGTTTFPSLDLTAAPTAILTSTHTAVPTPTHTATPASSATLTPTASPQPSPSPSPAAVSKDAVAILIVDDFHTVITDTTDSGSTGAAHLATARPTIPITTVMISATPGPFLPPQLINRWNNVTPVTAATYREFFQGLAGLCVFSPDAQWRLGAGGAGPGDLEGPHGAAVYTKFRSMLNAPGRAPYLAGINTEKDARYSDLEAIEVWETEQYFLFLVLLDTKQFTIDEVYTRTNNTLALMQEEYGIKKFVINMSFAILPCKTMYMDDEEYLEKIQEDYLDFIIQANAANKPTSAPRPLLYNRDLRVLPQSLQEALEAKVRRSSKEEWILDWLKQNPEVNLDWLPLADAYGFPLASKPDMRFLNSLNEKKLRDIFNSVQNQSERQVIQIAAAGNFGELGYNYPFAPAYLDGVVSVTAYEGYSNYAPSLITNTVKATYANPGEVMMGGALVITPGKVISGTSFAAPELSLLAAAYLLNPTTSVTCSGNKHVTTTPPLASKAWENAPLQNASVAYCKNFFEIASVIYCEEFAPEGSEYCNAYNLFLIK